MIELPESRLCRALPGDDILFRFNEETILIKIPVKDIFPQYEDLKRILMDGFKGLDK